MLSMWTTNSKPNSFIYRNCNASEQGAEKKSFFFCQSKFTIMDVANLQQKNSYSVFLRQKNSTGQKLTNQSWLKNSRHQSLIANWLIKARRFCIITIWCEMKMGWNECGMKWLWGEMNVGWSELGVKWMWGEMIWGEVIWGEMILGWNERTPYF